MGKITPVTLALSSLVSVTVAQTAPPNWVGPKIGAPIDTACYRKTQRSSQCPLGYNSDKLGGCWAQCPLEYPVSCGMECLPQNKDCTLEIITKIGVVANVTLNLASNNVIGALIGNAKDGIKCGVGLFQVVTKIVKTAGELQIKNPNIKDQDLVLLLLQDQALVRELTLAITGCAGVPTFVGDGLATVIKLIVERIVTGGKSVLAPDAFVALLKDAGIANSIMALKPTDLAKFKSIINGDTTGLELKSLIDRVVAMIIELKKKNALISSADIRVQLMNSALYKDEFPAITARWAMRAAANGSGAFDLREELRKVLQLIVDKIIDSASQAGFPIPIDAFVGVIKKLGLEAIVALDSTGIIELVNEFVQPICGPTSMVGEIDDGPANLALGLRTMGNAFSGSYGTWTKAGNGMVKIWFESADSKDVTVNIQSGGTNIASVPVAKGARVEWTKPIAELQDKTLYLDRWRPGFIGIPGTGGGSLLAWIPRSSQGGNFELHATLKDA